jgi:hypothetical protein
MKFLLAARFRKGEEQGFAFLPEFLFEVGEGKTVVAQADGRRSRY